MKTKIFAALTILLLAAGLAACGGSGGQSASLDGTAWVLAEYQQNIPLPGTEPTLSFEGGQVSGKASCNSFGGGYSQDGDTLNFGDLFQTEMYCTDPEGVMDQESAYLGLLGRVDQFKMEDGRLILFSSGEAVLVYDAVE